MAKFGPRNVVITGASGGIGQALALSYAREGVVLGLVGRNEAQLGACAHACGTKGARVVVGVIDIRDAYSTQTWLDAFDDQHPIDLLIANAGVASTLAREGEWEASEHTMAVIGTNLMGTLHTVEPVIARMRARGRGQIALICSLAALRGMPISPAYCASKAALKVWGEAVRPLLARKGVRLSIVLPGFVKTAMSDVFPSDKPFLWSADKAAAHIKNKLKSGRMQIAFPGLLAFGMRLLSLLPAAVADAILDGLSYVPRKER